jgi:lysophospholipase L1-like esterase
MPIRALARFLAGVLLTFIFASCGSSEPERTTAAALRTWNYVALGDSLAVGAIAQQGYVPRYATLINTDTGKQVQLTNLGVSGWQSSDLLNALRNDQNMRTAIQNAQVVTFDIGGNDLLHANRLFLRHECGGADNLECFREGVTQLKLNWDQIIATVISLKDPNAAIVRTMNIYNPFVSVQQATGVFTVLRPFLDDVNAHIQTTSAAANITVADVYTAFNGPAHDQDAGAKGWMSIDGVHPNDQGHEAIAEALRATGYSPLQ